MFRLDKLSYEGEECDITNRSKLVSEAQERALHLIEKHFKEKFQGKTFGEAWDFIKSFIGRTYWDSNSKQRILFSRFKEELILDAYVYDGKREINGQKEYFDRRHKSMLNGDYWPDDDPIYDEKPYFLEDSKEILYDLNYDDEELD